jgi:hypothetical protein
MQILVPLLLTQIKKCRGILVIVGNRFQFSPEARMNTKTFTALALIGALWAAPLITSFYTTTTAGTAAAQAQTAVPNWFDPATWMAMPGMAGTPSMPGAHPQLNLATPGGWAAFMRPSTYGAFMNPATYGQFMSPQFYMQFANPNNMMSWMNPAAYSAWMNPGTYMQWMNPAEYMAFMNPASYMQWMNPGSYAAFMNPATYMQWMNPMAYTMPQMAQAPAVNWFDPNAWTQMMQPGQAPGTAPQGQTFFNPFDPSTYMPQTQAQPESGQ